MQVIKCAVGVGTYIFIHSKCPTQLLMITRKDTLSEYPLLTLNNYVACIFILSANDVYISNMLGSSCHAKSSAT